MISSHTSRRPDQHHDPYYDALCPECGDLEEWVDREDRLQVLEDHLDEVTDESMHTVLFKMREW